MARHPRLSRVQRAAAVRWLAGGNQSLVDSKVRQSTASGSREAQGNGGSPLRCHLCGQRHLAAVLIITSAFSDTASSAPPRRGRCCAEHRRRAGVVDACTGARARAVHTHDGADAWPEQAQSDPLYRNLAPGTKRPRAPTCQRHEVRPRKVIRARLVDAPECCGSVWWLGDLGGGRLAEPAVITEMVCP